MRLKNICAYILDIFGTGYSLANLTKIVERNCKFLFNNIFFYNIMKIMSFHTIFKFFFLFT